MVSPFIWETYYNITKREEGFVVGSKRANDGSFERKLTELQKRDIFRRTLDGEKTSALAKEFNVSTTLIRRIKYDPKRLREAEKSIDAHQTHARLRIHSAAMKGIEKEHEILDREVPEGEKGTGLLYLQHQVATSMMDRDGLTAVSKAENRVEISFGGDDIPLGMPPKVDEEDA